jgi:hypothetical protein
MTERGVFGLGGLIAGVLLVRFGLDFGSAMPVWLGVPAWALVLAALALAVRHAVATTSDGPPLGPREKGALLGIAPVAFVASSLDCSGLSLEGCTATCTVLKLAWLPMFAVGCVVVGAPARPAPRAAALLVAFTLPALVPHCVCRNWVNLWWIHELGSSPMCFGWGFVASLVALGALARRSAVLPSLAVSGAITCGTTAFFVGHHYFHFPW